jgi:hypothetical protein
MSTANNVIKMMDKLNTNIIKFFLNPIVKYTFLIVIVIGIIFMNKMSMTYLEMFDNMAFKIMYALLVAYSACFDPIYAIALTTFVIIAIQELYSRRATKNMVSATSVSMPIPSGSKPFLASTLLDSSVGKSLVLPSDVPITPASVTIDQKPDDAILLNDAMIYATINKQVLQRVPAPGDTLVAEYDYYEDPAYRTITANLENKNYLGKNKFFVTNENLNQIQTNQQPNVNPNTAVQAFPQSMNIQGLPNGFDKGVGGSNPELASITSP